MATHVYQTNAFILGHTDLGESHRLFHIFSEELGLIHATARSVRQSKSKLRYSLQRYSLTHFSLVRGRDMWRITGAVLNEDVYHSASSKGKQLLIARIALLVRRLVHGEEQNNELFDILFTLLQAIPTVSEEDLLHAECLTVLRMLKQLGYVRNTDSFKKCFESNDINTASLEAVQRSRKEAIQAINTALAASHL